ncbi:MAG TPA: hypothetical protein VJ623_08410 [Holophagaceae bacterium]|nr:hypothetical protein [Holophagaceae bacterium]
MRPVPVFLGLVLLGGSPGCSRLAYPFARAFGGPSEAELRACRPAFERMKAGLPTAVFVVHPALVPKGPAGDPLPGTAERLAEGLRRLGAAQAQAQATPPEVAMTPLGRNQMRFTWTRARAYGTWVRANHPPGDFHVFQEMLRSPDGVVRGMMLYVVESSGQVAFVSLWNSHHFEGGVAPASPEAACDLMLLRFRKSLTWDAQRMFPPYGIG